MNLIVQSEKSNLDLLDFFLIHEHRRQTWWMILTWRIETFHQLPYVPFHLHAIQGCYSKFTCFQNNSLVRNQGKEKAKPSETNLFSLCELRVYEQLLSWWFSLEFLSSFFFLVIILGSRLRTKKLYLVVLWFLVIVCTLVINWERLRA